MKDLPKEMPAHVAWLVPISILVVTSVAVLMLLAWTMLQHH